MWEQTLFEFLLLIALNKLVNIYVHTFICNEFYKVRI